MSSISNWAIYETRDDEIPETMQPQRASIPENIDIDTNQIHAEKAFEVFAGKRFLNSKSLTTETNRKPPEMTPESPFERFARLKMETEELFNDLELANSSDDAQSPAFAQLASGVRELQARLAKTNIDSLVTEKANVTGKGNQSAIHANDLVKAASHARKLELSKSVKYELYLSSGVSEAVSKAHMSDLEERITRLENILGVRSASHTSTLPRSLSQMVSDLETKISLLDESKLSIMSAKAKRLSVDTGGNRAEPEVDVKRLLRKVEQYDQVAEFIPTLVDRLTSLQEIHAQNAMAHTRIGNLETLQKEMEQASAVDRQLLENLKLSIAENVKAIQNKLDSR